MDPVYKHWSDLGLHTIKHVYIDNCLLHLLSSNQIYAPLCSFISTLTNQELIRNFVKQSFSHLDQPLAHSDFYYHYYYLISQFTTRCTLTAPQQRCLVKDMEAEVLDAWWANEMPDYNLHSSKSSIVCISVKRSLAAFVRLSPHCVMNAKHWKEPLATFSGPVLHSGVPGRRYLLSISWFMTLE